MSSVNSFSFTGRLGADAELKYTQSGTAIWSARVAVDYGWGDKKGTTWINAKSLGKQAESLGNLNLSKGTLIGGSGELQVREYERKDGGTGTSVECLVNGIALLSPKPEGSNGNTSKHGPQRERPAKATDDANAFADDDIPFVTNRSAF